MFQPQERSGVVLDRHRPFPAPTTRMEDVTSSRQRRRNRADDATPDHASPRPARRRQDPRPPARRQTRPIAQTPAASPTTTVTVRADVALPPVRRTERTIRVATTFGLALDRVTRRLIERVSLCLSAGRIVLLHGPSGTGKTTVMKALAESLPHRIVVDVVNFPRDKAIIDAVGDCLPFDESLALLSRCALGEAPLWLRSIDELSCGQRSRAALARALAVALAARPRPVVLCDEFAAGLHRRAARGLSYNLRRLVSRHGYCAVVATCSEDPAVDLSPDVVIQFADGGRCTVDERSPRAARPFSLRRTLTIEAGRKQDYEHFAAMHYRSADELGFVDKVYLLRERGIGRSTRATAGAARGRRSGTTSLTTGRRDDILGIIVYAHGPRELALRNEATGGRFLRNLERLNRECRIIRRLVIHPDVRGCGLGRMLVRRTLSMVGTRFVECLATMGDVNPVFERAGMRRIGRCVHPQCVRASLDRLRALGVDPCDGAFTARVCRSREVRDVVADAVATWYWSTVGNGDRRVARQSPEMLAQLFRNLMSSRPVYYLWEGRTSKT